MSIIDFIRHDLASVGTIWASVGLSELSTNDIMQRLMWTLAIIVSVFAIVKYLYRFYKWLQGKQDIYYDDDE